MPIVVRWSSALTAGLDAEAYELLLPLDRPENLLPPGAVRQSILANCAAPDLVSSICMIGGDCPALVEALMEGDPLLAEACGDGE